jgi:hypothetical protein
MDETTLTFVLLALGVAVAVLLQVLASRGGPAAEPADHSPRPH